EVHRAGALTRAQLVSIAERVFEQLHDRQDAARLVLDLLDGRARLADVREEERDSAAALRQLQRRVDAARDRLHVVLDAQQEAAHERAALRLARVEERRRGRLEAAGEDLVDELPREVLVAVREREARHDDAVLEALEVAPAVERLERVARVVLE